MYVDQSGIAIILTAGVTVIITLVLLTVLLKCVKKSSKVVRSEDCNASYHPRQRKKTPRGIYNQIIQTDPEMANMSTAFEIENQAELIPQVKRSMMIVEETIQVSPRQRVVPGSDREGQLLLRKSASLTAPCNDQNITQLPLAKRSMTAIRQEDSQNGRSFSAKRPMPAGTSADGTDDADSRPLTGK